MNVLIVSQHFWPETFRINEVVESLRHVGCKVQVLTGQPNYPEGAVFPGHRAMGWGRDLHPSGYTIYRVPLMPRGTGSALRLVGNYLSFIISGSLWGAWLLRRQQFDVILVYGTSPILQGIVGIVLRARHRARLVTWVQDLWPQSLEVTGYVRNRQALAYVAAIVRWIYRRNDLLLVQSHAFLPTVQAMAGSTPVEVHPNPGERALDEPLSGGPPALELPAGFNVVFAGNLGTAQSLETVIDAAKLLQVHAHIHITLVGSGSRLAWLQEQVRKQGLSNVNLPGRFDTSDMPGILTQASALLVSLARSPIMSLTVPSKIQAYLAAGKPVIASLDGEGARLITEARAGITAPAQDSQALANAILELSRLPPYSLEAMGRAGRTYYEEHFHPESLARQLRERFIALSQVRCLEK